MKSLSNSLEFENVLPSENFLHSVLSMRLHLEGS
jgi:hypothetical protein